jgi:hypothetical protein
VLPPVSGADDCSSLHNATQLPAFEIKWLYFVHLCSSCKLRLMHKLKVGTLVDLADLAKRHQLIVS